MGSAEWDGAEEVERAVAAEAEAERSAIAAAKAVARGQPVPAIEAALVRELRARRVYVSPEEVHLIALGISDPAWGLKHPRRLKRLMQNAHTAAEAREAVFTDEMERTMAHLQGVLDSLWRLRRSAVSACRTMDGVEYEIRIDTWSARRANKLQRRAAPTVVTVKPWPAS